MIRSKKFPGSKWPVLTYANICNVARHSVSRLMLAVFLILKFHHCDHLEFLHEFAITQQNRDAQDKHKISTVGTTLHKCSRSEGSGLTEQTCSIQRRLSVGRKPTESLTSQRAFLV